MNDQMRLTSKKIKGLVIKVCVYVSNNTTKIIPLTTAQQLLCMLYMLTLILHKDNILQKSKKVCHMKFHQFATEQCVQIV